MKNFNLNKSPNQKGFTLIELLVVISVIGVLSSSIILAVNDFKARSTNTSIEAAMKATNEGLEFYHIDYARYPRSNGWDCLGRDTNGGCWSRTGTFVFSNNHTDLDGLKLHTDVDAIPTPTEGNAREGIIYRSRNGGDGYELIYLLQGTSEDCRIGYRRSANEGGSGNTSCTICGGNYDSSTVCRDRF